MTRLAILAALFLSACAMPIATCERQVSILFTGESVELTMACPPSIATTKPGVP